MTESSTPRWYEKREGDLCDLCQGGRAGVYRCAACTIIKLKSELAEQKRAISEDNAFHDALQELAVAQGKDPEQWDPIGVVDDALAQQDYAAAIAQALDLVLPMARGYAAEHPVGNNATMIEQAEAALDSTPRGAVAASAAEAYAVALQSALQPFADEGTKMRELYERDAMADSVLHMHITYGDLYRAADVLAKNPNPAGHPAAEPSAHESGALAGEGLGPVGLGPTEARHEIGRCSAEDAVCRDTAVCAPVGPYYCTAKSENAVVPKSDHPGVRDWLRTCRAEREKLRGVATYVLRHPRAACGMGDVYHYEWVELQRLAKEALADLPGQSENSQDTGFAEGWRAAIAAAATWVDRKGWEGTANALADDLCEPPPQEGHATCNPQEADRGG